MFENTNQELELSQDFEVIDLQNFISDLNLESNIDDSMYSSSFLNDLIPDESLYSRYLNGEISFDDLMREIHHADSNNNFHPVTQRDESSSSNENNDPDYEPPIRRSKRRKQCKEISNKPTSSKTSSKRGRGRKSHGLPIELAQYLGEAERYLNNDEFDQAEKICYEILGTAPRSSQPYVVLAEINYRRGNHEKTKELLNEAVLRNPSDVNTWLTLCDLAEEKNELPLAVHYTRQALKHARHDMSVRQRLINYCQKAGRIREALHLRMSALSINPEVTGEAQFKVARELADEFFKLLDPNSSVKAYELAFEKFPLHGTDNDRNTVLSMLIQMKQYAPALKFFIDYCGVKIFTNSGDQLESNKVTSNLVPCENFVRCDFPKTLPPELTVKLFLILVHLGLGSLVCSQIRSCFHDSLIAQFSDWLIDIIKAYKLKSMFQIAIELLLKLLESNVTCKSVAVWILLAECYLEEGKPDDAIRAYRHVTDNLDPRHTDARLCLVNLFKRLGKHDEALEILNPSNLVKAKRKSVELFTEQNEDHKLFKSLDNSTKKSIKKTPTKKKSNLDNYNSVTTETENSENFTKIQSDVDETDEELDDEKESEERIDTNLLKNSANLISHDPVAFRLAYERCRVLDTPETIDLFLEEAWALLFSDVTRVCGSKVTKLALNLDSELHRKVVIDCLASVTPALTDSLSNPVDNPNDVCQLSGSDVWGLFLRLVDVLRSRLPKSLPQLETATSWACLLPHVHSNDLRRVAASHLLISSSLIAGHGTPAFLELRDIQKQWGHKNQYWNVLNLAITLSRDFKHCRFLDRLLTKDSSNFAIGTIASSDLIVRGSYRYAAARLIQLREIYPHKPLLALLLAVAFLCMSLQKHVSSRHLGILQSIGFLGEYQRLRGPCQEVYYNLGRAYHQLNLSHLAIHYYEKVLNMDPVGNTEEEKSLTNLQREAAFNLALLYRTNNNPNMAHYIMQNYLVI